MPVRRSRNALPAKAMAVPLVRASFPVVGDPFEQELHGRVEVFDEEIRPGLAQSFFGEGAPANGDAQRAGCVGSGNVEGGVADVGGLLRKNVPEQFKALQERGGM